MQIAVLGNCQAPGLARCIRVMAPAIDVIAVDLGLPLARPEEARKKIQTAAHVFVQTHLASEYLNKGLPDLAKHAITYPYMFFPAFHPDNATLRSHAGFINGDPFGPYNSKIVAAAHVSGLSVEQAASLFTRRTYDRLGYIEVWADAWKRLHSDFSAADVKVGAAAFQWWARAGCFMFTPHHPHLHVLSDIAHAMLKTIGVEPRTTRAERHAPDDLARSFVLPVFPEIAERFGEAGDYVFKLPHKWGVDAVTLTLPEFVARSYAAYDKLDGLGADRLDLRTFLDEVLREPATKPPAPAVAPAKVAGEHPYSALPAHRFWRLAVTDVAPADVDPIIEAKFKLARTDKVATFGSCFAQHISQWLQREGIGYYVAEQAPASMPPAEALARSFGVYSARYGNLYTARQFAQLFERAYDPATLDEPGWMRPDRRIVDPFRPMIEPAGFASEADMQESRAAHLASVRELVENLDVVLFTLGLTEAWRARDSGAVFPVPPGVVAGDWDRRRFEFVNFNAGEVVHDIARALELVRNVNPTARAILTVSPVPIVATYENRHVLESMVATKSILRTAADEISRAHDWALYFPSYEIVSSPHARGAYFGSNLRSVTPEGVDHVMRLFLRHLYGQAPSEVAGLMSGYDLVCEEEVVEER